MGKGKGLTGKRRGGPKSKSASSALPSLSQTGAETDTDDSEIDFDPKMFLVQLNAQKTQKTKKDARKVFPLSLSLSLSLSRFLSVSFSLSLVFSLSLAVSTLPLSHVSRLSLYSLSRARNDARSLPHVVCARAVAALVK